MPIRIILPDNSEKTFDHNPTVLEVAQSIGPRLAQATIGGVVDGKILDLRTPLQDGAKLRILTEKDPEASEVIRHSAAHIMAQAVQELWPDVKVTIGPVIENGFYYDFDSPRPFSPDDLQKIEDRMNDVIKRDLPIVKEDWSSEKAIETFGKMGEKFKVEIIQDLKTTQGTETVSVYHQGEWFDLCRGPHVQKTGQVKAIKVMSLAGAYWRGDEKREQLQRVYATAFTNKKELETHLNQLEEAKKRDHRKLGKEMGLFHFHPLSPGGPFFAPKGALIYNTLQKYIRELYVEYGYEEVITPQIFDVDLYHQSGHYDNYRENMYFMKIDERDFSLKPMNCPGHCVLYSMDHHSYRDLPWRVADFGRLHRYERSGVMHGLTRVRTFCQDDAHIFCTVDQLMQEVQGFMRMFNEVYKTLGMTDYTVFLSTRPEKRIGSDDVWDKAEGALSGALNSMGIPFKINPGDGAFYGPKLDFNFKDSIGRNWQLGTLQLDFNLPTRFGLKYSGEDNKDHSPVMIHRAVLGTFERFIGVYIEHCAGHLPTWLAPEQAIIMNIQTAQEGFCKEIEAELKKLGVRARFDGRFEKLGYKIREAQLQRVPYMLVVGEREMENRQVTVRLRTGKNFENVPVEKLYKVLETEVKERRLESPLSQESGN